MDNQGITSLADQHLNGVTFFFSLVVAVTDQHILVVLLGDNVHGFHQRTKEGIRHIHHHHANGVTHLGGESLRIGVGPIA
ncbi:hypothetical protein D3C81_1658510 [compost metagenome]